MDRRRVVAMGGGGFPTEPENRLLDRCSRLRTRSTSAGSPRSTTASACSPAAADDSVGLVFAGQELAEVVASRPDVGGYRAEQTADGGVSERRLAARYLGPKETGPS